MSDNSGDFRTPLARVSFLGSSRHGTFETWIVHVTGIALVLLSVFFVLMVLNLLHMDYNGWRATLGQPIPAILLVAFTLAGAVHMEIGMRSIIIDYVDGYARAWALLANTCFAALLALACVYATLRISFT
jgi:succinate dehydrogenase / fumarate reductase, membrane anchor subunit